MYNIKYNYIQGARNQLHFGFTCRDPSSNESCIGYIFKCESESVANELVTGKTHFIL